jgi:tartrate dehydratase alpha subunit/fumarate hydratase class I-like protein
VRPVFRPGVFARDEEALVRAILLDVGSDPRVAIYRNPTGEGYYANIRPQIRELLPPALWRQVDAAVLMRSRVTYGLGPGSPDLVGIGIGGRFVGLEVKSMSGRLQPTQQPWHDAARNRGARVEVVRDVAAAREAMGI